MLDLPVSAPVVPRGQLGVLIAALKATSAWDKLAGVFVLAGPDKRTARVNWKTPGRRFADATSAFAVHAGFTGDGVATVFDSGYVPSRDGALNSLYFGAYYLTGADGSAQDGATTVLLLPKSGGGNVVTRCNDGTSVNTANPGALAPAYYSMSRSAVDAYRVSRNGTALGTKTTTSTSLPTVPLMVGRWSGSSTYNNRQCAAMLIGSHLTDEEDLAVYTPLAAYMVAVGAHA